MSEQDQYCMKWNNYHSHIGAFFANLLESESLVDVTLCADGQKFQCHRVILSACSTYFQEILSNAESKHPIILLPGISPSDIKAIIEFIYHGELNNINYDKFSSILKTAEALKISGLMEVIDHLPAKTDVESCPPEQANCGTDIIQEVSVIEMDNSTEQIVERVSVESEGVNQENDVELSYNEPDSKPLILCRKQGRDQQKKYSEGSFTKALSDMMKGMSLGQAAKIHKIPRSTLYAKAKQHAGLNLVTRRERSNQECQAAIQAIAGGMSLQRASDEYGIPKTVLWRRVQKRLDISCTLKNRRKVNKCLPQVKEAALNALASGEKLVKVSAQYEIPVSTLFKEKSRLLNCDTSNPAGGNKALKHVRLSLAVAACKEGKMSQGVASNVFQVPKTTIWRRLQKASRTNDDLDIETNEFLIKTNNSDVHLPSNCSSIIKDANSESKQTYVSNKMEELLPVLTTDRAESDT